MTCECNSWRRPITKLFPRTPSPPSCAKPRTGCLRSCAWRRRYRPRSGAGSRVSLRSPGKRMSPSNLPRGPYSSAPIDFFTRADELGRGTDDLGDQRVGVLPVARIDVEVRFLASARKAGSFIVSSNALRSAATRSAGTPGTHHHGATHGHSGGEEFHDVLLVGRRQFKQRRHVRNLALALEHELHQQRHLLLGDPVRPRADEIFPRRRPAVNLAALHRDIVVIAGRIPGDELEAKPSTSFIIAGH